MQIRQLRDGVSVSIEPADLALALADRDTLVWVDLPPEDPEAATVLGEVFCFHPRAVEDCARRNPTPKLHLYADHAFVVLHAPDPGESGHVHSIELDLFLGPNYVVTVHGPLNPTVDPEVSLVETKAVARRLDDARWHPDSVEELVHAIVTGLNRRMNQQLSALRQETWELERTVTSGAIGRPEDFLEEMFGVRLGLQAIRTMAALNHEVYGRMARLHAFGGENPELVVDSIDQFERVMASADVQRDYLQGVIDFYQTRINTKMTVAAERLAVIAAITLPVTAISSVMGMNVIVNDHTRWGELTLLVVAMGALSTWLLLWTRRQGWW
jgi:magnesium transporter